MFRLLLLFALVTVAVSRYKRPLVLEPYPDKFGQHDGDAHTLQWCTYNEISHKKCLYAVATAQNNSIPLVVNCILQASREDCINSVKRGVSDMVVLTGHGYKPARKKGLRPFLFAKEDEESLYIAVAPRNITFIDVQEAPIYFDPSKHRAFHAATFFNLNMGHDICSFLNKASMTSYISIVDSATYKPNPNEILICPSRVPDEFDNYKNCNIEAGLQRAVFTRPNLLPQEKLAIFDIFQIIIQRFNSRSDNFNFFDTFQGEEDVIFKKNTISLDFSPTYRNDVDERVFDLLHCDNDEQPHDPRVLQ